jgi:hypothetical protein
VPTWTASRGAESLNTKVKKMGRSIEAGARDFPPPLNHKKGPRLVVNALVRAAMSCGRTDPATHTSGLFWGSGKIGGILILGSLWFEEIL